MLGWTVPSPEGGVPEPVGRAIVRALLRSGRVTFPCSIQSHVDSVGEVGRPHDWRARGDDAIATFQVAGGGLFHRLATMGRPPLTLLSTRREAAALELFEDPVFEWWNAAQFALVSRPPEIPPRLPPQLPSEIVGDDWTSTLADLEGAGVEMMLRSGVDGDVCGVAFRSRALRDEFEGQLENSAAECGLAVRRVSSVAFGDLLAEALNQVD